MANLRWIRSLQMLVLGAILGGLFVLSWERPAPLAQQNSPQANPATMQADVAHLKDIIPPNSHPMVEVGMLAANLWFAGEKKNWPLANYYLNEMRNRIRWEVHLNPGPKGADGNPVDMQSIFDGKPFSFAVTSEVLPGVERSFDDFAAAAEEASLSRVFAGVHFRTDEAAGERLGGAVADFVVDHFLRPLEDAEDSKEGSR